MQTYLLIAHLVATTTAAAPGSTPLETDAAETPPAAPSRAAAPSHAPATNRDEPVVRAHEGDWGMTFRFGGLGTLFATGNTRATDTQGGSTNVLLTQVGLKKVIDETWMVPIYFGAGMRRRAVDSVGGVNIDSATDWGFDVGAAIEYHFRIWRRISPYVGFGFGLGYSNPAGDDNGRFGVGMGPILGVEYYVFDHVSLQASYMMNLQIERSFGDETNTLLATQAGGALNLTFYF
ncbi:MAG: outer membrane beta-barrel protein [Deltaproteobacteria bacterium]|nr:outer membrane beta-barrel protein [Deltaproteobacteria bacterium]